MASCSASDFSVNASTWKELFKLADEVASLTPWEYFGDSEAFGVQGSEDKDIGWCCVLGNAGQVFAINFHRGSEGLGALDMMFRIGMSNDVDLEDPMDVMVIQSFLGLEFVTKSELESWDKAAYKAAGLRLPAKRGALVPRFISKAPDHMPWRLSQDEAERLIRWLTSAVTVFYDCADDPDAMPETDRPESFPLWRQKTAKGEWHWESHQPQIANYAEENAIDIGGLELLGQLPQGGRWSLGVFPGPGIVAERNQRPFLIYTALVVDEDSGMILKFSLERFSTRYKRGFDLVCDAIRQSGVRPELLVISDRTMLPLAQAFGGQLAIKVVHDDTPMLFEAMEEMIKMGASSGMDP